MDNHSRLRSGKKRTQIKKRVRRRSLFNALQKLEDRHLLAFDISLFANINQLGISSVPEEVTEVNGEVFFVADDGRTGSELWKTDGTEAGTVQVSDIFPGFEGSQPSQLTALGNELFFVALDEDNEFDLWKSDGTESGTVLVFDANANGVYYPTELTASGSRIFFTAYESASGYELWSTDGTNAGTALVRDINPDQNIIDRPQELTDVNGTLFFTSYDDGYYNRELWKSDGTAAGTVLVKDIGVDLGDPGPDDDDFTISSNPYELTNINGTLYFVAEDFENGVELFQSDGTSAGTSLVSDLNPGGSSSYPRGLTEFQGDVFFSATDGTGRHLYRSDGVTTSLVAITSASGSSTPTDLTVVGNDLYFSSEGSVPVLDVAVDVPVLTPQNSIRTGSTTTLAGIVTEVTPTPDRGFIGTSTGVNTFTAEDQDTTDDNPGWVESGADIGFPGVQLTTLAPGDLYISDIDAGELTNNFWEWTVEDPNGLENISFTGFASGNEFDSATEGTGEGLVFELALNDVFDLSITHEVFGTDLDNWFAGRDAANISLANPGGPTVTKATVRLSLGRIVNGAFSERLPDGGNEAIVVNASLTADLLPGTSVRESIGRELHRTDGTAAGTTLVKDIGFNSSSNPDDLTASGGNLFFSADEVAGTGRELWVSDGTEAGTVALIDSLPGNDAYGAPLDGAPQDLVDIGGTLLFTTLDANRDREFWTSDGTSANTTLLTNINTATQSAEVQQLTESGTNLFFVANDGINGEAVWVADTVTETVTLAADTTPSISSETITGLTSLGTGAVFYNNAAGSAGAIYFSDGTSTIELIAGLAPIPFNLDGDTFVESGGSVFFVADDGTTGEELWRTDGTVAGTVIVSDLLFGPEGSMPRSLVDRNGSLAFVATDATYGRELFQASSFLGTTLLADINRNVTDSVPDGSDPDNLTVVGNRLYVTADDGISGRELWSGVFGFTLVSDINPAGDSFPTNLTNAGGTLYFSANDGTNGFEPFASTNGGTPVSLGDITTGLGSSNPSGFTEVDGEVFFSASELNTGVLAETFLGITGTSIAALEAAPNFPNSPDSVEILTDFQSPSGVADNYGLRTRGYLIPPETGDYTFWISSDDNGELLLSTDDNPANASLIANVPTFSSVFQWDKFPQQQSATITLTAGVPLYIEALVKEGGGGDHLEIGWAGPSITGPTVIRGEFLSPFGPPPGDQGGGRELWKTDGTLAGTQLVTDLQPGVASSSPIIEAATSRRALFSAIGTNGELDRELWVSGGTPETTILVEDLNVGSEFASDPTQFIEIGGNFFFTADDGLSGTELYRLREFAPVVASVDVGAEPGVFPPVTQTQRSTLETVTLTFDESVVVDPAAIQLRNRDTNIDVTSFVVNQSIQDGATFVELTFDAGPSVQTRDPSAGRLNSLEDGNYELTILAAGLVSNETGATLDADLQHGTLATDQFFRFFGDQDGDRVVDITDLGFFAQTFRQTDGDPAYNEIYDNDGNGIVDIQDLSSFATRFRNVLGFV